MSYMRFVLNLDHEVKDFSNFFSFVLVLFDLAFFLTKQNRIKQNKTRTKKKIKNKT